MDPGSHVGFQISTKNTNLVEDHPVNTSEKLTDGRRTLTHDKSSHDLWPGELKKGGLFCVLNGVCFVNKLGQM